MTWNSFHRRGEILRTVIADADARQDGCLPMDVDGVAETFGDELTLLGALQLRWHTRLAGCIERELMSQPMDLEAAVIAAWHETATELPGILAIIDHYRVEPIDDEMAAAMKVSMTKEHHLLAVMAGRSSASDAPSARVGEDIARRARATHAPARTLNRSATPSLVERLRAVLTAA
ncbi:MAG: hypothetical protein JWN68_1745 [Nocardioides sp.]|jgi:hypothetical protein|uniref:hypothetical protein n=1 Tax=Nocardioides sp. TaxID=35761 RepID=UPI002619812A|nr:hypothetical protein [Nocardioides sp.]MCW2833792.1 hypothetical protein [Nocardioides sp.]